MVKERIIRCIARLTGLRDADIKPDDVLEGKLGMDSLDKIELAMALEEEFEVMIEDSEAEACVTVADVVVLVERVSA